jgi:hypothetical protein
MSQSSIEFLINQIEQQGDAWENASIHRIQISIDTSDYLMLKQQAKAMHKRECFSFYEKGADDEFNGISNNAFEYYKEKFGVENE